MIKKILIALAMVFCASTCWAGPFGVSMNDPIDAFNKLKLTILDGRQCYAWLRPVLTKNVEGTFFLFFNNDKKLTEMLALSKPVTSRQQATKDFKAIYNYVKDFGGLIKGIDGRDVQTSKVDMNDNNIVWYDFQPDRFSEEQNEICRMELRMDQMADKKYVVSISVVYRNSQNCREE